MRVAAIDMGSNSFLCLIAEKDEHGHLKEIYDTIEYVKLGEGIHVTHKFSDGALTRAEAAFKKFYELIKKYNVDRVETVATSAARDATNKDALFELGKKYQIPIHVISGNSEADLTFLGVKSSLPHKKEFAVLDIGGGSTEIAFKRKNEFFTKSYDVGCVRLTELFLKMDPEKETEMAEFKNYLEEKLSVIDIHGLEMFAVAGTPTTLASLYLQKAYDPKIVEGFCLKRENVQALIQKLHKLKIAERKKLPGIDAPRADVIMAGALIMEHVMKKANLSEVTVSTRGIRYGLAFKKLGCRE